MKTIIAIAAASATLLAIAGVAGAAQLKAANSPTRAANISCSVPNNVSCTITSRKGIKSVLIKAGAAQNNVALVNRSYRNCPTRVDVTWDSAFQMGSKTIVECAGFGIKAN